MSITSLRPNALLMLIDLQQAIDDPSWGVRNNPDAEACIGELLSLWRQRQMPILHVKHMSTEPNSTYRPSQPGNQFKAVARPLDAEEVLEKTTNSAFIRTELDFKLRQAGITQIVMAGVITNNSVEATARMAGNLGFETIVVSDGTFTFGRADFDGIWRTAEEVHAMSLANLHGEYATVMSTAAIMQLPMQ